eukprot:403337507
MNTSKQNLSRKNTIDNEIDLEEVEDRFEQLNDAYLELVDSQDELFKFKIMLSQKQQQINDFTQQSLQQVYEIELREQDSQLTIFYQKSLEDSEKEFGVRKFTNNTNKNLKDSLSPISSPHNETSALFQNSALQFFYLFFIKQFRNQSKTGFFDAKKLDQDLRNLQNMALAISQQSRSGNTSRKISESQAPPKSGPSNFRTHKNTKIESSNNLNGYEDSNLKSALRELADKQSLQGKHSKTMQNSIISQNNQFQQNHINDQNQDNITQNKASQKFNQQQFNTGLEFYRTSSLKFEMVNHNNDENQNLNNHNFTSPMLKSQQFDNQSMQTNTLEILNLNNDKVKPKSALQIVDMESREYEEKRKKQNEVKKKQIEKQYLEQYDGANRKENKACKNCNIY